METELGAEDMDKSLLPTDIPAPKILPCSHFLSWREETCLLTVCIPAPPTHQEQRRMGGRSKNSSVTTARLSSKTLLNFSKARILYQIHKQVIYKTPEQVPKLSVKEKQESDEIYCPKSALSVRGFILFGCSCNVLLNVIVKHKKIFIHKYSVTYWTYNELQLAAAANLTHNTQNPRSHTSRFNLFSCW